MARLINADKRIAEIKKIYCDGCDNYGGAKCRACWVDDAMCLIDDATTVDAVPVVRCRDCKQMIPQSHTRYCTVWHGTNGMGDDGFCNYGERNDGDGDG